MATIPPAQGREGPGSSAGQEASVQPPEENSAPVRAEAITTETEYQRIQASTEFQTLRDRYRKFAFIMTAAFLGWYLLFVLFSSYAKDFMGTKVIGNINVALIFGLLQFVSTFVIAWLYSRYANNELDPIASELKERIERDLA
jgi:uncharacterized membrane protein (DUF485 family)